MNESLETSLKARKIVIKILQKNTAGDFCQALLEQAFRKQELSIQDKRLITEMVYGMVRHRQTLNHLVDHFSRHKPPQGNMRLLLSLGFYQLLFLNRIPPYAAIHTSVELAKKWFSIRSSRYINALLRRLQKETTLTSWENQKESSRFLPLNPDQGWLFKEAVFSCSEKDIVSYRSEVYSFPFFLVKSWHEQFGHEQAQKLLISSNLRPPLFLRLRGTKNEVAELKKSLEERGVSEELVSNNMLRLVSGSGKINELPGYKEGKHTVLGIVPASAVECLDPRPQDIVLDLCAAPGGKSLYIADLMKEKGEIIAADKSSQRLKRLQENMQRLGIKEIVLKTFDGTQIPEEFHGKFDRVLLDAPCSNSGVFGRRVEARWRFSPENIKNLSALQFSLLQSAATTVKQGGALVYSTCSIDKEENDLLIERFLKEHTEFSCTAQKKILPLPPNLDGGSYFKLVKN